MRADTSHPSPGNTPVAPEAPQSMGQAHSRRGWGASYAPAIAIAEVALIASFAFMGMCAVWDPDEGRYSAVALEMLRTGDWLHPALNHDQPHYTKPPVTYWAIAASILPLGQSEIFSARNDFPLERIARAKL